MKKNISKDELYNLFSEYGYSDVSEDEITAVLKKLKEDEKASAAFHRAVRDNNRAKSAKKKERDLRTHQLCNIGGAVIKFYPALAELYPHELETLFEKILVDYDDTIPVIINDAIENRKSI